ncbi:MAG TPA: cupredoxin domain-containing protein [Anaerolineales bacterium]|nr:cupredoxin domain-containing protein [Anaerolineales bacterium]
MDRLTFPSLMKLHFSLPLFVMAGLVVAFVPLPVQPITPQERILEIDARQYAYSPFEIRVNQGDVVTLHLVSTDVVHGIYIDGYDLSIEADPGQYATLTFTADKAGSFRFRCNITCGAMHPFMIGKLTVGTNNWLYRSIGLATLAIFGTAISIKQKA